MNDSSLLLSKIIENNSRVHPDLIKRILIVYDLNMFAIGDTCIQVARFRKSAELYKNATIDLNTLNEKHHQLICNIIKNNPYISNYFNLEWDQLDFSTYDLIICACIPELPFFDFLSLNYSEKILSGLMTTAFFSVLGNVGFDDKRYGTPVFPINRLFNEFKMSEESQALMGANELFITDAEIEWGTNWLSNNGLSLNNNLVIFLDSSSARDKLLDITQYFDLLTCVLRLKDVKVLIFDEGGIGKKEFYEHWLGPQLSENLIFAERMTIRDAICLIGSKKTKFIFGPSTGLLHCASGVFNVLMQKKYPKGLVPVLLGYVGKCEGSYQEDQWWGQSLVDTVLLIRNGNRKELNYIKNIDFEKISSTDKFLSSQEITCDILVDFIRKNYSDRLKKLGINMENTIIN
ncbi:MAG: hypothetical protein Q8K60_07840 [Parachlamydiaceae bacterium]|nr:hypothetical protein [Parachlamydiaceae bacterium]